MDRSEWVRVPRVPTEAMVDAARGFSVPGYCPAKEQWPSIYTAMLSAAPPPPADSEDAKAFQDMLDTGTGFMLDGKRIAPERVRVVTSPPAEQASGEHVEAIRSIQMSRDIDLTDEQFEATEAAIAALSQRPVVDEAMVERAMRATGWLIANPETMRAALTAALAPQQPTGEEE